MSTKCICLDGEGVIWHAGRAINGAKEAISQMRELGFRTVVITNNASRSNSQYLQRFKKSGYPDFDINDIITSAVSVTNYLLKLKFDKPGRKVFVIGTEGFVNQLKLFNINIVTIEDFSELDIHEMELDTQISAVVVGSSEEFSYRHLTIATRYVIENDAMLISANPDSSYPFNGTVLVPGAYSLAKCIGTAANREPIALGKPNIDMFEAIPNYKNIDKNNSWMIGDRLNTDIKFAKQCGLKSILVLTGISKLEDLNLLEPIDHPDFICKDLNECIEVIKNNSL